MLTSTPLDCLLLVLLYVTVASSGVLPSAGTTTDTASDPPTPTPGFVGQYAATAPPRTTQGPPTPVGVGQYGGAGHHECHHHDQCYCTMGVSVCHHGNCYCVWGIKPETMSEKDISAFIAEHPNPEMMSESNRS